MEALNKIARNVGVWAESNTRSFIILTIVLMIYGFFHFGLESSGTILLLIRSGILILLVTAAVTIGKKAVEIDDGNAKDGLLISERGTEQLKDDDEAAKVNNINIDLFREFGQNFPSKHEKDAEQDFSIFLEKIVKIINTTFAAESTILMLKDKNSGNFTIKAIETAVGEFQDNIEIKTDSRFFEKLQNTDECFYSNNKEEIKNLLPEFYNGNCPESFLAGAIIIENNPAGTIIINSNDKNAYSEEDLSLVNSFTSIVADTIANYGSLFDFENSTKLFSFFYEVNKGLSKNLEKDEIFDMLFNITEKIFSYDRMSVNIIESDENNSAVILRIDGDRSDENKEGMRFSLDEGLNGCVIRKQKSYRIPDIEKDDMFMPRYTNEEKSNFGLRSFLGVPVKSHNNNFGSVSIESKTVDFYNEKHENILNMICSNFGAALERYETLNKLEKLATTDELTDLLNFRSFQQRIKEEVNRSNRYGFTFALMMIDLDHFKKINDNYGHQAGNEVLKKIAAILKESTRNVDFAFRFGGEEFAVILIESKLENALNSAERIRKEIEELTVEFHEHLITITTSIGLVEFSHNSTSAEGLVTEADRALYKAKENGRNNVVALGLAEKQILEHNSG